MKPRISLQVNPTSLLVDEYVAISGSIIPARAADVVITVEDEEGHREEQAVSTTAEGTFSLTYKPDHGGTWYVTASLESTAEYAASTSERVSFHVKKDLTPNLC